MLFNSVSYLLFLPIVVGLYWLVSKRARPLLLLLASYYFYMSWFAKYGLLLALLTSANYAVGLILCKKELSVNQRKSAFVAGLSINLGCLIFFKYVNFLLASCWQFLAAVSHFCLLPNLSNLAAPHLHIILPLGISFFVFEFIHYLVDIYEGSAPIKNPIHFGLFAAFFPSQIAGPIKRFQDFDAQLLTEKPFDAKLFQSGCWLIGEGMFKKVVLGDNLAPIVQLGFAHPQNLTMADAWICTLAFALQIYYDFSGYTDIGRGSAMLFGYRLPENFNKPYLATSLIDFWHRWHMSLSTWLRDYLYKPLGGSRNGILAKNRNLLITMLLGGLWHGASWHYVLWGGFHGLGLICNHAWRQLRPKPNAESTGSSSKLGFVSSLLVTVIFVMFGWVLFRAHSALDALAMYHSMFNLQTLAAAPSLCLEAVTRSAIPAGFAVYVVFQLIKHLVAHSPAAQLSRASNERLYSLRWWLSPAKATEAVGFLAWAILILGLAARAPNPFIYFQF